MIGNAAVMGWTPREFGAASLTEYRAALAGWNRARGVLPPLERSEVDTVRRLVADVKRKRAERGGR